MSSRPPTEVVVEGKKGGYPDALLVEKNLMKRRLRTVPVPHRSALAVLFKGGERELVDAYQSGHYSAVISDDEWFVRRASNVGVDVLTPAAALVLLHLKTKLSRERACEQLEALRPYISGEEYAMAAQQLKCGGGS